MVKIASEEIAFVNAGIHSNCFGKVRKGNNFIN